MSYRDASVGDEDGIGGAGDGGESEGLGAPNDRFPGERTTTDGLFSGTGDRLVHVHPDGSLRDFGYPLSGLSGIDRSRFALVVDGELVRFEDCETTQRYVGETTLVETNHHTPTGKLRRLDLTAGRAHLTRFDVSDLSTDDRDALKNSASDVAVVASIEFTPDGRTERVGQLRSSDAVEVYHATEGDFLASSTGFATLRAGYAGEALGDELGSTGGHTDGSERYEEERLSPSVTVRALPDGDGVTFVSLLVDRTERQRSRALDRLRELIDRATGRDAFERMAAGRGNTPGISGTFGSERLPATVPGRDATIADLRALALLSAPTGLRIAGPDFDPAYRYSGGYGYTWFRDDAEISGFLLSAEDALGLEFGDAHRRNAGMYCRTQLPDGTWPHRVWPADGSLAPGWANSRIETGGNDDYQADQTASVLSFLARFRDRLDSEDEPDLAARVDATLEAGLDGLDATLGPDGLPVVCQNAWEDAAGRFAHTTATVLEAYATIAGADAIDEDLRTMAGGRADRVYDAVDRLWVSDRNSYGMCETPDGSIDPRYDSASLALASAHRAYDRADGDDTPVSDSGVDDERLDRLVSHVDGVVDGLYRDPGPIEGLVRYEGDEWRSGEQASEKIWTVSTAWGASAAAELSVLLSDRNDPRAADWGMRARDLLQLVEPEGPLSTSTGYLPEQFFDDGTPDSATPLGWPHAIRLATRARLLERGFLSADGEPVVTD